MAAARCPVFTLQATIAWQALCLGVVAVVRDLLPGAKILSLQSQSFTFNPQPFHPTDQVCELDSKKLQSDTAGGNILTKVAVLLFV